jgi:hypothetical protein
MYNLHYVPTTLGYKVEEKLYLGVREQKKVEYHWFKEHNFSQFVSVSVIR